MGWKRREGGKGLRFLKRGRREKKIVSHFAIKTDVNADLVKFSSFNEANKHVLYPVEPADGLFTRYLVSLIHFMGHFFLGYGLSEEQHMACNLC